MIWLSNWELSWPLLVTLIFGMTYIYPSEKKLWLYAEKKKVCPGLGPS